MLLLRAEPHVLHHRPRESPGERGQQRRVVAQAQRQRARERAFGETTDVDFRTALGETSGQKRPQVIKRTV